MFHAIEIVQDEVKVVVRGHSLLGTTTSRMTLEEARKHLDRRKVELAVDEATLRKAERIDAAAT